MLYIYCIYIVSLNIVNIVSLNMRRSEIQYIQYLYHIYVMTYVGVSLTEYIYNRMYLYMLERVFSRCKEEIQ